MKHLNKHFNTNIPWTESPLFNFDLNKKNKKYHELAKKYNQDGYVVIDLKLNKNLIRKIDYDLNSKIKNNDFKKNPKMFHYNDSPRVIEAWKFSQNVKKLAMNKKILDILQFLYEKKPIPISTINFLKGTEQPLHSDYMHFASMPPLYLAGAWVALEKTNKFNGPIVLVPGSHKLPIVDYNTLGVKKPKSLQSLKKSYRHYENYIKKIIKIKRFKKKKIYVRQGQAIIWAANLLHGGSKMIKKNSTRKSQVIHYHFDKCEFYYNPSFSNPSEGEFAKRKYEEIK